MLPAESTAIPNGRAPVVPKMDDAACAEPANVAAQSSDAQTPASTVAQRRQEEPTAKFIITDPQFPNSVGVSRVSGGDRGRAPTDDLKVSLRRKLQNVTAERGSCVAAVFLGTVPRKRAGVKFGGIQPSVSVQRIRCLVFGSSGERSPNLECRCAPARPTSKDRCPNRRRSQCLKALNDVQNSSRPASQRSGRLSTARAC